MQDIKLIKLEGKNIRSYTELLYKFNTGVTLIHGDNQDRFSSNGAGKTTILEAVYYGLYGECIRDDKNILKSGTDKGHTRLMFTVNGVGYSATRHIFQKKSNALELQAFDSETKELKDITLGTTTLTQQLLVDILGISKEVFMATVLYHGKYHKGFANLTDKTQKELFNQILDLGRWEDYAEVAKKHLTKVNIQLGKKQNERQVQTIKMEGIDRHHKELMDSINSVKVETACTVSQERHDDVKARIDLATRLLAKKTVAMDEAKIRLDNALVIKGDIKTERIQLKALTERRESLLKVVRDAEENQKTVKGGMCPTCGQALVGKSIVQTFVKTIRESKESILELDDKIEKVQANIDLLNGTIRDFKQDEYITLYKQVSKLKDKLDELKREDTNFREVIAKQAAIIQENNKYINELQKNIQKREQEKDELIELMELTEKEIFKLEKDKEALTDACTIFGRSGIQNQILKEIEQPVTYKLNSLMRSFGYKKTEVRFSAVKELSSGELRDKVDIKIHDSKGNTTTYGSLSNGEASRVDLVFFLALNSVLEGRVRLNVLFADEILNNLDEEGSRCISSIFQPLKDTKEILVLSPNELDQFDRDRTYTAVKANDNSTLVQG